LLFFLLFHTSLDYSKDPYFIPPYARVLTFYFLYKGNRVFNSAFNFWRLKKKK